MHPTTWAAAASSGVGAVVGGRKTAPSAWVAAAVVAGAAADNAACSAGDAVAPMPVPMAVPMHRQAGLR
ncbi:hypothetical protein [Komagataeibacter diospyri]|uniref:hypothetical protein n=1 Tax=Komagataeibacter diospyri TaxID=1932662 RepID=UPI0012B5E2DC|nr:hypothetical protein [Komagataeibacter diospyri]